jgi:DNA-binding FrmR family transcriptional regulator
MTHIRSEKQKLLNRIRRIRGQLDAVERALEAEAGCAAVLQQVNACHGALHSLTAELVEDHIREHVMDPDASRSDPRAQAAEQLVEIVRSYLT